MIPDELDLPNLLTEHRAAREGIRTARAQLEAAETHAIRIKAAVKDRLLRLGLVDEDLVALMGEPGR